MLSAKMIVILSCMLSCTSCEKTDLEFSQGDLAITIDTGEHWLHDFPLFWGISKKNPPQFAVWIEDTSGRYISTIFVTKKIATEGWISNGGNRRKEALPYWCHRRGIVYDDGLLLPTKEKPLTDGVTGATPKNDKTIQVRLKGFNEPVVIKAEFNHSVDFNSFFPKNAAVGDTNYSGGKEGSGQPAIVYEATVFPGMTETELKIIGYSSPDGADGNIHTDLEKLTTAKSIVKKITVKINK